MMITSILKSKKWVFALSVLVSLFFLGVWPRTDTGGALSFSWQDFLYSFRLESDQTIDDIVIVAVDEPSFREMGLKWPWPRRLHGNVVDNLSRAGAKAIIFDMLFSEPSMDPEDDRLFAEAIQRAGNVSLGKFASMTQRENYVQTLSVEPVPILRDAAAVTGYVNHFPDADGIVRQAYKNLEGSPSLAYSGCLAAFPDGTGCQDCPDDVFLIDFKPEAANLPIISYYQVLNNLVAPEFFTDKIVFVGLGSEVKVDAQGAADAFPTPFFRFKKIMMYGVEIHANSLVTLLSGCWLQYFDSPLFTGLFLLISIFPFWVRRKPMVLTAVGTGGILGVSGLSFALFNTQGLILDTMPAALAIAVNTLFLGLNEFRQSHKEKRFIKQAFESYVSSDIVKNIISDPSALTLGGERKDLTVMFSDINGFTTVSEALEPEELVSQLNEYLQLITQVLMENQGTLDKYIGDAVMAFFGAPVYFEDHAYKSCQTAVALDVWLNRKENAPDNAFTGITIGINSGPMIVGNVGSEKRFDYTVIGDTVNLAARLEALNKAYRTAVIIGESTKKLLAEDAFLTREMDYVKVKGKHKAISIYELLEDTPEHREKIVDPFAKGLTAYRNQDWQQAIAIFSAILETVPSDGPSQVFLERCRYFSENPPSKDWDMIWTMKTK